MKNNLTLPPKRLSQILTVRLFVIFNFVYTFNQSCYWALGHESIPEILKHPPSPLSSPDNSNIKDTRSKPHKPCFPYLYPHGSPYAPLPYPFYPPSTYSPHGYQHPSYDPYLADMMAWKQHQSLSQGIYSSEYKRICIYVIPSDRITFLHKELPKHSVIPTDGL